MELSAPSRYVVSELGSTELDVIRKTQGGGVGPQNFKTCVTGLFRGVNTRVIHMSFFSRLA